MLSRNIYLHIVYFLNSYWQLHLHSIPLLVCKKSYLTTKLSCFIMESFSSYLSAHEGSFNTLYYPGAGTDFSPFYIFGLQTNLKCAYYTDYYDRFADQILHLGQGGYMRVNNSLRQNQGGLWPKIMDHYHDVVGAGILTPQDFGTQDWQEFFLGNFFTDGGPAHGVCCSFVDLSLRGELVGENVIGSRSSVRFNYLGTDGIGTAPILLRNGIIPDVLVLQDHGLGGNYSHFGYWEGKENTFYDLFKGNLPNYLFTEPDSHYLWPGYEQVTDVVDRARVPDCLQPMHHNKRALFKYSG